jgi:putative peptide zinc metalloprotease protein
MAPARAEGVELLGPFAGSGYRRPPSLVRRADGQTIQLTPLLYQVLESIDGRRGYEELASDISDRVSRLTAPDDVRYLVEKKLRPLGLLRRSDGSEPTPKKLDPLLALRLRKVISKPEVTRRITAPFAQLFRPIVVVPVLVAFAVTSAWVLFDKGLASATHQALYAPGMLLLILALTTVSAGFHEFGHAAAARYEGVAPGAMGVGLYLVWPVFYTDVTEAYGLRRSGRLRVDVGGLYFNAIFAVATVGVWAVTGWDALLLLVPVQLLHMLHQLVPFVRFDGYHILADLTGVPDLFSHIKPTLLHMLPTRWGKREPGVLRPRVRAVVTVWVLTVVPVLGAAFVFMVKVLPRVAATVWDSLGVRWGVLQSNWANGNGAEVAVGLLSMAAVALPVLSMSYLLVRVVRRSSLRVWRATAERPAMRAMAVLTGVALSLLLAWAWWPSGQYEPIRANERGTLLDAGRGVQPPSDAVLTSAETELAAPSTPVTSLQPRLALVLSPQGVPVTEPGPKQIIVLPPPGEDPAGYWPFPFDPPAPPGEGDNQALAVNTGDGSSVYDVAFAIVWVTDGPVDQVNEAWAVASCTDCRTVAVAFQGIFVLGDSNVVIPQNIAVAINYDCRRCETEALAVQLISTLTRPPSNDAMSRLELVWNDLQELEESIGELSLDQIYSELVRIETAILEILVEDGAVSTGGSLSVAPSSDLEATSTDETPAEGSTTGSDTTTIGDDPSAGSDEPSPTPSGDPSPTPSEDPSPTPTSDPSPSPTAGPSPTPTSGA